MVFCASTRLISSVHHRHYLICAAYAVQGMQSPLCDNLFKIANYHFPIRNMKAFLTLRRE